MINFNTFWRTYSESIEKIYLPLKLFNTMFFKSLSEEDIYPALSSHEAYKFIFSYITPPHNPLIIRPGIFSFRGRV